MTGTVGAIILAAGFSNRFGAIKLNAQLASDKTVFEQTLERIKLAIPARVIVTRPEVAALLSDCGEPVRVFEQAEQGMGATLAFGVNLARDWDGYLICLADMPFVETSSYQQIAEQLNPDSIVIPAYQSQTGNPVGFGRHFFDQLTELSGDAGARSVIQQNQAAVTRLALDDPGILHDIDTPEDLMRYSDSS